MEKYRKQLSFLSNGKINISEKRTAWKFLLPPPDENSNEFHFHVLKWILFYYAKEGYWLFVTMKIYWIIFFFLKDASINSQVTGYIFPFNRIEALLRIN